MNVPPLHVVVLGLVPCLIPPYALRLNRVFGTQRVGWMLFGVFSLLAALELVRYWRPLGIGIDQTLALDLLYLVIPVLLLIGMRHIEMLFKERLRLEQEEKRLRAGLEVQVQERTADLAKANEELQQEIALRKQGEEALRKSKEEYRFLFDQNPLPMWIYDLESFRFLAFNAAALRHYGYTGPEFRTMTAQQLCPPDEAAAFVADSARTSSWAQARGLWRHRQKDGSLIDVEIAALDLVYADRPARLVQAHDVTAQRMLQQQLQHFRQMEVTAQLAGGVADRFTQLIAVLEGEANTLAEKCQDPAAAEPLKRIAATAGSAADLTRQLLALVGRYPMQVRRLDLNALIENQIEPLTRLLGNAITLKKTCAASLPAITADPALVGQILHQFALNARDAMPHGGTLTLNTAAVQVDEFRAHQQEEARPGPFVSLTVSDTGCGMTPEIQGRLFEPFFTTKPGGQAAGLGLATVHGLVKQHSGWIEVASQPGAGARFTIYFPCDPLAEADTRQRPASDRRKVEVDPGAHRAVSRQMDKASAGDCL